jgi:hypothetical protein
MSLMDIREGVVALLCLGIAAHFLSEYSDKITWQNVRHWISVAFHNPRVAGRELWSMFRDSWQAITFVVVCIYGFGWSLVGHLVAASICFLAANLILVWALSTHPNIHGPRGARKEQGYRAAVRRLVIIVMLVVSGAEWGGLGLSRTSNPITTGPQQAPNDINTPKIQPIHPTKSLDQPRTVQSNPLPQPATTPASKAPAPEIRREDTTRYAALVLGNEFHAWMEDMRTQFPDYEQWKAELYRQYPTRFRDRIQGISEKLKKCGADTSRLKIDLAKAENPSRSILFLEPFGAFESFPDDLRTASRDIPGGQPACGTKTLNTSGFHEKDTGIYQFTIGGPTVGFSEEQLMAGPVSPMQIYGMDLFKVYLDGGRLYVDTTLYGGSTFPAVQVRRNEISIEGGMSLDRNFTDKALEVVDRNLVPLLQIIYEADRKVVINGVFIDPKGGKTAVIITPTNNQKVDIDPTGQKKVVVPLKRIFKYPSWKYPGVYADD